MSSAAVAPPTPGSSQPSGAGAGKNAARARNLANQKRYANPLPILFNTPSSSAASSSKSRPSSSSSSPGSVLSSFFPSTKIEVPECIGTFDPITRSVWIEDERSKHILFTRGFFGKGSLSRSEPSWRERRVALLKGGATLAAEQMREQRRIARKQFKIDRAAAMLDAAKQAEAILTSSVRGSSASILGSPSPLGQVSELHTDEEVGLEEGNEDVDANVERPGSPTPSTSTIATENTVIDPMNLTAQTFLVRPTRPEANRNRGRKAFKRRPPPASAAPQAQPAISVTGEPSSPVVQPRQAPQPVEQKEEEDDIEEEEDLFDESLVEEMEHLQLSLEEVLFLTLGLGVLRVFDPTSQTYIPNGPALLSLLLTPPSSLTAPLSTPTPMLPDDPLLVSYIAYHHYRSLGWVVKDGIKFCCDWLLYRRGPAFSHSAFACIVIPVYEDPAEKESSPYGNEDWYDERMSWKWVNTIMRVNALVQKTVMAVYVTIPSLASFDQPYKLDNGYLDPGKIDFKSLLGKYTVREVSLTRFGPSRRRD